MSNTIYLSSHTLEVHPYIFKTLKLRHNNNIQESTSQQLYLNTRVLDFQRQRPDTYRRRPFAADQKRWSWSLFQLLKKNDITLLIGAHRRSEDGVVYRINKIIMHAGFSMTHLRNDIALLRLAIPVKLNQKMGAVCFPKLGSRVFPGTKRWITGLNNSFS